MPTAPATTIRPRRELLAWRNAVFVIFALSGLSISTWVARLPAIRDGLGLTTGEVGLLILGMSAGSIVGLIAAPLVMGRIGARRGIAVSLLSVAVGLTLIGLGAVVLEQTPVVLVGLVLFGAGNGSADVMMNVEGAAAEKELRKTVLPLMHAAFSLGTVIGAGIGAGLAALHVSVAWHTLGMAVLIAATALVAVRFLPAAIDTHAEAPAGSVDAGAAASTAQTSFGERIRSGLSVWRDGRLIMIGVIMLGMAFAEGSANDWLTLAVVDDYGTADATGAAVFSVFVVAMTVGRVVGGPLIDRFGRVPLLRVSALSAIVGLSLFIFGPALWVAIVGTVLWGLGSALGFPVGMSAAADDSRNAAARVSAVAMIGYFAFLVGPPLIGVLGEHVGLLNALIVVLALVVMAGLASPAAREQSPTRRGAPAE